MDQPDQVLASVSYRHLKWVIKEKLSNSSGSFLIPELFLAALITAKVSMAIIPFAVRPSCPSDISPATGSNHPAVTCAIQSRCLQSVGYRGTGWEDI